MTSKGIRHIGICLFILTLFTVFVITPVTSHHQENGNTNQIPAIEETEMLDFSISFNILQNDTDTTNSTTTSEDEFSGWIPFIDEGLYYPLALIFSFGGIFSVFWLIFFVETSKERTIRERIIGTTIRLIIMAILTGFAIHFWILFEPI